MCGTAWVLRAGFFEGPNLQNHHHYLSLTLVSQYGSIIKLSQKSGTWA